MRVPIDWPTAGGLLALAAALLLASPGVRVVRAEDGPQSRAPAALEGPACSAGTTAREAADFQAWMSEIRQQAAAEASAPRSSDRPIPLNNRGYNYGPAPAVDIAALLREVAAP